MLGHDVSELTADLEDALRYFLGLKQLMSKHRVLGRNFDLNGKARTARANQNSRSFRQLSLGDSNAASHSVFGTHK